MRPTDVRKAIDGVTVDHGRKIAKTDFVTFFDKEVMPVVEKWKRAKAKKHITDEDRKIFKSVFDQYDKDKTGDLDAEELASALAGLEKELGSGKGVVDDKKRRSAQVSLGWACFFRFVSYIAISQLTVVSGLFT